MVQVGKEDGWMEGEEVWRKVVEGEVWVVSDQGKGVEVVVTGVQGNGEGREEGVVGEEEKGIVGGFS